MVIDTNRQGLRFRLLKGTHFAACGKVFRCFFAYPPPSSRHWHDMLHGGCRAFRSRLIEPGNGARHHRLHPQHLPTPTENHRDDVERSFKA